MTEIGADEIATFAAETIDRIAGPSYPQRYRAWREVKRIGRPLVVGGARSRQVDGRDPARRPARHGADCDHRYDPRSAPDCQYTSEQFHG